MTLNPGIVVRINTKVVAAVSSEHLNIISVRLSGDVLSSEIATLSVTGGYYGEPETRHLLWVVDQEISEQDEVEIQFQALSSNSHPGQTIEEVYPEPDLPTDDHPQSMVELAEFLRDEPPMRNGFDLYVSTSGNATQKFEVRPPNYSFSALAMWNWRSEDSAKFSVSSSSLQDLAMQQSGTTYLRGRIGLHQSMHIRIASCGDAVPVR
jgi:hypothetical protein